MAKGKKTQKMKTNNTKVYVRFRPANQREIDSTDYLDDINDKRNYACEINEDDNTHETVLVNDSYKTREYVFDHAFSRYDTQTNVYGETVGGKVYRAGVKINAIIDAADQTTNTDEFGPDRVQTVTFSFLRQSLRDIDFVVDVGDVVNWNDGYWEINSKNENQLVGGQTNTDSNYSVVCEAYLMRISHLNIERVRSV